MADVAMAPPMDIVFPKGLRSEMGFFPTPSQCNMQSPGPQDLVKLWHEGHGWNEDYTHLALDGLSDAIMQIQRKSLEKVSIWDKLSQAINSGLLRVIALKLRKIYEKFYRKLTALVAIPVRIKS